LEDHSAVWSPNGGKIAFARCAIPTFVCDVWSANADGSGPINLTATNASDDDWPIFTPDGSRILLLRANAANTKYDLYEIDLAGQNARPLTNVSDGFAIRLPRISPDGTTAIATQSSGATTTFEVG